MVREVTAKSGAAFEPLYAVDARTGATVEVFFAGSVLAASFGARGPGWLWWACQPGALPSKPQGPFHSNYLAFRDALGGDANAFGRRARSR